VTNIKGVAQKRLTDNPKINLSLTLWHLAFREKLPCWKSYYQPFMEFEGT